MINNDPFDNSNITPKEFFYNINKYYKERNGDIDRHKIYLARNRKTPVCVLNELLLEDDFYIIVTIYNRRDFEDIKPFLKNLDEKNYEFYQVSVYETLKLERLQFSFIKFIYILIIIGLALALLGVLF